jgi:hypothetical protein
VHAPGFFMRIFLVAEVNDCHQIFSDLFKATVVVKANLRGISAQDLASKLMTYFCYFYAFASPRMHVSPKSKNPAIASGVLL